ncbi:MAG: 23S rRNA (uracil(1939)-C(5))-methyltransferase RlmD [Thalassotalea sp.]
MATFFQPKKTQSLLNKVIEITITRLNQTGVGVGRYQNKAIFVEHTIVGEVVKVKVNEQSSKFIKAKLVSVLKPSPDRVAAECRHFQLCGGCDLQHLAPEQQLAFKQKKVIELFARADINYDLPWQPSIVASAYGYRRKVRIGVQYNKNDEAIVGFRQKQSNHLISITACPVMVAETADIFPKLKQLIDQLSLKKSVGHIEVITTDNIAIVVRQLIKINPTDTQLWLTLAKKEGWTIYLDDGAKTQVLAAGAVADINLTYSLLDQTQINFSVDDFIQVNHAVNQKMVAQAINWLELQPDDRVLDLFCGLGNFTLPMAKLVNKVIGIEGVQTMVDKAQQNASSNDIANTEFYQADLNKNWQTESWFKTLAEQLPSDNIGQVSASTAAVKRINKVVLDPARAGAELAIQNLAQFKVEKILYVSCEPASLARDSAILIQQGYKIEKIALMDMFSQTKHLETMVLFVPSE